MNPSRFSCAGIDLSVGAVLALAGMVAFDLTLMLDVPGYIAIPVALIVATLCGALNGVMIVKLRLQPFIATLSTLAAYRGLVYAISGRQLVPELATTPLSDPWIMGLDTYFDIGSATGLSSFVELPWFPLSFFIMLATLVVFGILLSRTRFGRDIFTVGGNAEAARLAGINVGRTIIIAYAICGFCAGLAALLMIARLSTATESLGLGMEMSAIAAAVIGGVSLSGGIGGLAGPVIGTFLLGHGADRPDAARHLPVRPADSHRRHPADRRRPRSLPRRPPAEAPCRQPRRGGLRCPQQPIPTPLPPRLWKRSA